LEGKARKIAAHFSADERKEVQLCSRARVAARLRFARNGRDLSSSCSSGSFLKTPFQSEYAFSVLESSAPLGRFCAASIRTVPPSARASHYFFYVAPAAHSIVRYSFLLILFLFVFLSIEVLRQVVQRRRASGFGPVFAIGAVVAFLQVLDVPVEGPGVVIGRLESVEDLLHLRKTRIPLPLLRFLTS